MAANEQTGRYADETLRILTRTHAILQNDHFVYISGDHGSGWINKDAIFPNTRYVEQLCGALGDETKSWAVEVVCGPAVGGLIVAMWTAHALGVLSVFSEHDPTVPAHAMRGSFVLRREYDQLVRGKRVLVVDDIIDTGLSIRQTTEAVRAAGGQVVGAACLVSRGNVGPAGLGIDRFAYLLECKIPGWPAETCKLCQDGVPINPHYAHGREYLVRQQHGKEQLNP